MARYKAHAEIWLGHENRKIAEGQEFETDFPDNFKPGGNVEALDAPKRGRKKEAIVADVETEETTATPEALSYEDGV
jgi:hypothetical protein